jgi:hypothetical protein
MELLDRVERVERDVEVGPRMTVSAGSSDSASPSLIDQSSEAMSALILRRPCRTSRTCRPGGRPPPALGIGGQEREGLVAVVGEDARAADGLGGDWGGTAPDPIKRVTRSVLGWEPTVRATVEGKLGPQRPKVETRRRARDRA